MIMLFLNYPLITLISIPISKSIFKNQIHLLYENIHSYENGIPYKWLFFGTLSILIIQLIVIFLNKREKKSTLSEIDKKEENSIQFNELEKNLIKAIIEQSNKQNYFTVVELNLLLGVKNKSIEIQKKVRNEAIIKINHKFNVNYKKDTIFIERIRSLEDRRYFNYYINDENIKTYLRGK